MHPPGVQPPPAIVELALKAAMRSPCEKSKRGVAAFRYDDTEAARAALHDYRPTPTFLGFGWNGPPGLYVCTGDDACRKACPKICIHAEMRAIDRVVMGIVGKGLGSPSPQYLASVQLVHVKLRIEGDGRSTSVVGGGGPSCWQCSRLLQEHGIGGIWLYEEQPGAGVEPVWRHYDKREFHEATLRACELPAVRA